MMNANVMKENLYVRDSRHKERAGHRNKRKK
jgi:hypothetical protein